MRLRTLFPFWLCLVAIFSAANLAYGQRNVHSGNLYPLSIKTQDGNIAFQVEVASTPEQLSQGLMFRENMPQNHGMIFLYSQPRVIRMWMKNTLISLDMIFIDQFGNIRHIVEGAIPHDENVITSAHAVVAVLELNAGQVRKHGIQIGDIITLQ